LKEEQRSK